ncbi:hypothetical protein AMC99_00834 [Altererythrobacter epoxidivorans]|uniref:Putative Flp pilus-assembly TadG-like N-terminal domain-containing protein n=1 Tax=Altererythrobacter epoxidivorans TaxID=361183 RepID=A0A0M5KYA9_9SPHN|nr:Tad domain-containing protein [Altererythrobacter epoxidivorans]ALE16137.1 hypothetical protein AMC99_00834 [Altererythrobacter epoxidivorans]
MNRFLRNLASDTAGNALMMFAAALVPILMMIGSGVDASITYMARSKMQNACDAAVLAGRLAMIGTDFGSDAQSEANKFFNFNFPNGTNGVDDADFDVTQDPDDPAKLLGTASGTVPTTVMFVFGYDQMPISVSCDAKRDMGHNDVMLVLDMTSSMLNEPSWGGGTSKVQLLRDATGGLYRALSDGGASSSVTRYGFVPFSQTVNVARQMKNNDIVRKQYMVDGNFNRGVWRFSGMKEVSPRDSWWNNGHNGASANNAIIQGFRTSGEGCIEERPAWGNDYDDGEFVIGTTVTLNDVNEEPKNGSDEDTQFGRYEPERQEGWWFEACVSESKQFATYADEDAFNTAVNEVSTRVEGGTVADIGMLWGLRLASRDGMWDGNNPKTLDDWPVNVHLIFFTDGQMYNTGGHYTAYGIEAYTHRVEGDGVARERWMNYTDLVAKHNQRFSNMCTLAKSMGMTIWVVALDTLRNDTYVNCATSASHYYESDGSDLEDKFTEIGQGIGNLRLTK